MIASNFAATLDRAALVAGLKLFGKVVSKRNSIPILSHLLLECDGASVTLTGTDLDIYASVTLDAPASQPGKALVPCDQMASGLAKSKGATVSLQSVPGGVAMTLENGATTRLATTCGLGDWPEAVVKLGDLGAAGDFVAAELRDEWTRVRPAVSTEETRYYLNGIYACQPYGGGMAWAATDGHRLCEQKRDLPAGMALPNSIIPRLTVDVILAALAKAKGTTARMAFSAGAMLFTHGNVTIRSKLVDGVFPDYNRVIPSSRNRVVSIDAGALADAATSVVAGLSGKTRAARFSMSSDGQWLTGAARDADGNVSAMVIPGATVSGNKRGEFMFGVNAPYLSGLAKLFPGDVTLATGDASTPILMESTSLPGFRAVVMPMHYDGEPLSPAGIADMNKPAPTAMEVLEQYGPKHVAELAGFLLPGVRRMVSVHLGLKMRAAIDYLGGDRQAARAVVKAMVARMQGDEAAAVRIERVASHEPVTTFRSWSQSVPAYAGPVFNVVEEPAPVAQPVQSQPDDVAALKAMILDMAARLARVEAGQALSGPQTAPGRTPAHEAAIRRAWAERSASRAARAARQDTAKLFVVAEETIATVTAQRDDFERIAIREGERADRAEAKVEVLETRVGRLKAVLAGRKAKLVQYARELLFARDRGAQLQRELIAARDGKAKRSSGTSFSIGRKAG